MLSGDLGYVEKERLQELRAEIGDVERMLKALIKSLGNKHLNPGALGPRLPTNWEKNHNCFTQGVCLWQVAI
jgi:hypothetical protein